MKYRKKPVVIEAEQFSAEKQPWPEGVKHMAIHTIEGKCEVPYPFRNAYKEMWGGAFFIIPTLEGDMAVSEGDWVITGVKGERYPCKPDIFDATYEPA